MQGFVELVDVVEHLIKHPGNLLPLAVIMSS